MIFFVRVLFVITTISIIRRFVNTHVCNVMILPTFHLSLISLTLVEYPAICGVFSNPILVSKCYFYFTKDSVLSEFRSGAERGIPEHFVFSSLIRL